MTAISIEGKMGSGKTATATAIAVSDFIKYGRRIIANYRIDLDKMSDETKKLQPVIMPYWKISESTGRELCKIRACHDDAVREKAHLLFPNNKEFLIEYLGEFIPFDPCETCNYVTSDYCHNLDYHGELICNKEVEESLVKEEKKDDVAKKDISQSKLSYSYLQYDDFVRDMQENKEFFDVTFLIDEAYLWADSRLSQTAYSRLLTYFYLQSRKRSVNVVSTTQQFENVDKRMRSNTDIRIHCRYDRRNKIIHNLMVDLRTGVRKRALIFGPDVFRYYNTHEIPPLQKRHTSQVLT